MRTRALAIAASIATLLGLGTARVARASLVESPDYTVTSAFDAFELRAYGPTIEARAPIDAYEELNQGFRMVGGYIFGANVNDAGESEKIAMTAPVGFSEAEDRAWISFVMPAGTTMADLPRPQDSRVSLVEVPGRTLAALRFAGKATPTEARLRVAELQGLLAAEGIVATGAPIVAQYNPPWTPGFLRRNEILVPVAR